MTDKECLEKCADMWWWMMLHPNKRKQEYFCTIESNMPTHACYCCEYVKIKFYNFRLLCKQCLLLELWLGEYDMSDDAYDWSTYENIPCQDIPTSPYKAYFKYGKNLLSRRYPTFRQCLSISWGALYLEFLPEETTAYKKG